jgi:dipeptidyl aminopeptidase/acylaminoacyl peptidase
MAVVPDAARRPIRAEDLLALRVPSDPRLSPDGTRVAFVVRTIDAEKNQYRAHLWLADTAPGTAAARQFTTGEVTDSAPRWSPDGRQLAFLRARDKLTQIWLIPADGGEARPLTSLPEGSFGAPAWAPDGARLAFTFRPTHPDFTREARKRREEKGQSTPARRITRLHYREDGGGWLDCRQHVWLCDVSSGTSHQLTDGDADDFAVDWSPDGTTLVFASNRSADPDDRPWEEDLWLVAADPPAAPTADLRRLPTPVGFKSHCAWSPDGRWIAYIGCETQEDGWVPRHDRLWVVPPEGGAARCLTADLDRGVGMLALSDLHSYSAGPAQWDVDSARLCFLAGDRGNAALYAAALAAEPPVALTAGAQVITGFSIRAGQAVAVITTPTDPGEVHRLDLGGGPDVRPIRALTTLNADFRAQVQLAEPEERWVASPDGTLVQTWRLKPPGFRPTDKYPAILSIHGGPHLQYGHAFFHELQWHAARGYVVAYGNPRGSANLGEEYMAAIRGAWGEKDAADLLAIADDLAGQPYVDSERIGVCGGSYGGFATNWLIGHTDRFACAVTDRSVVDQVSQWGQCDEPLRPNGAWPGNTWDDTAALRAHSPLTYVAGCTTPVLIIHSEGDWRCPIGQAQELFTALKRLGRCPVELIWYPPETSHGLSRGGPPDLRLDRLSRYAAWFDRFLKPQ